MGMLQIYMILHWSQECTTVKPFLVSDAEEKRGENTMSWFSGSQLPVSLGDACFNYHNSLLFFFCGFFRSVEAAKHLKPLLSSLRV